MSERVAWMDWSPAAFERAAAEDKPILLGISAVWCHWCHVMDDTTYSDPAVISKVNASFVPVRVDNDVRPDVNARYNMGGWPTTAFLTPDGMTITGATYLPPAQMLRALDEISQFYRTNKEQVAQRATALRTTRRSYDPAKPGELRASMVARVVEELAEIYDEEFAGFGTGQKFPQTDALELLILESRITGEQRLLEMATATMRAMASGGMYDHVEGGFFRYSTTRDWTIPHFEKMSEDHAGELRVLAQLAMCADASWITDTLRSATEYVRTVLRDAQTGLFAGSQDADEDYYAADAEQRKAMTVPFIDRRSYSNWTAGLAGAFFAAGAALDKPEIALEGAQALDALHERARDADGLLYHVVAQDGTPSIRGILSDQVAYVRALLDAYDYSGDRRFLERTRDHVDATIERFGAPEGGFVDHASLEQTLGNLPIADRPIGDNGTLADALLRLHAITGEARYREIAEKTLLLFAKTYARAGSFASTYALALQRYLEPEKTAAAIVSCAPTSH